MSPRTRDSGSLSNDELVPAIRAPNPSVLATPAGTLRFAERAQQKEADFWRTIPRGLSASAVGIGTYLGEPTDEDDAHYRMSVQAAIASGVNVIDTASNYRCQRSERSVGIAVEEAIAAGEVRRDELLICTKGGYIALDGAQPASRDAYQAWVEKTLMAPGVLASGDLVRGGHSIAPAFLAHQLEQSLANLRLASVDLYYLHNPEEQLLGVDRETFLNRIRAAFTLLEERAAAGTIGGYGCATWSGFRTTPDQRQHLSLSDLVTIAREIAGAGHHFRAVQLPISLAMQEAARQPTQELGRKIVTVLEAADALGLAVIASAALMQGRLTTGLPPQLSELFPECTTDAQRALRFVTSLPGVATALSGARHASHITENAAAWSTSRNEGEG